MLGSVETTVQRTRGGRRKGDDKKTIHREPGCQKAKIGKTLG